MRNKFSLVAFVLGILVTLTSVSGGTHTVDTKMTDALTEVSSEFEIAIAQNSVKNCVGNWCCGNGVCCEINCQVGFCCFPIVNSTGSSTNSFLSWGSEPNTGSIRQTEKFQ